MKTLQEKFEDIFQPDEGQKQKYKYRFIDIKNKLAMLAKSNFIQTTLSEKDLLHNIKINFVKEFIHNESINIENIDDIINLDDFKFKFVTLVLGASNLNTMFSVLLDNDYVYLDMCNLISLSALGLSL